MTTHAHDRDSFIEIWRGISVFLVVYFHMTARVTPDAMGAASYPVIVNQIGKVGVYIFFVISAFLIARSLESCQSLAEFYAKRISRIWPLFAVAGFVIFAFIQIFPPPVAIEGANRFNATSATFVDLLATTFFLKDLGFRWVDGAFWSILVELKFYLFAGLLAAFFGKRYITVFCIAALVLNGCSVVIEIVQRLDIMPENGLRVLDGIGKILNGVFIAKYLPFFAIGLAFYQRRFDGVFAALAGLCLIDAIVAISEDGIFNPTDNIVFIALLCLVLVIDHSVFSSKISLWFGRYSYSIYLFHQMIGLGLIKALTPKIGINYAVLLALGFVLLLAWGASQAFEWRYRRPVAGALVSFFSRIGLNKNRFQFVWAPGLATAR